jgi:general secretion pathway protein L
LFAVNLGLLMGALALHWQNGQSELHALEKAVSEVRREAAVAADLADNNARLRTEAIAMRERRTRQPLMVEVLEDLSGRLADDTYLQRLELREGQLRLYGISAAASDLISQLEASPLLEDVRFEASITRDAATGRERFSITAGLASPLSAMPPGAESGS